MKVEARGIAAFLRDPGAARVVLLHGDDEGMVRYRADALTEAVIGRRDDPFRVAWLSKDDHDRLPEEASAIAMIPGRRVVRVRDAGDALTSAVQSVIEDAGDSLLVLEAASLPARSKLRALLEAAALGAVIACYPEDAQALRKIVEQGLAEAGIVVEPDALVWLLDRLGADRASTRGELEKLILYAGSDRRLSLSDVGACVGDQSSASLEEAIFAATGGDLALTDRALERALAEGAAAIAVCRALLAQLSRLQLARAAMMDGRPAEEAVRSLRPPVFFKRVPGFVSALGAWPERRLSAALDGVRRVELACKQTGAQDQLLVRRLLLGVAQQTALARSGRR